MESAPVETSMVFTGCQSSDNSAKLFQIFMKTKGLQGDSTWMIEHVHGQPTLGNDEAVHKPPIELDWPDAGKYDACVPPVTRAISMFAGSTNGLTNANQIPPLGMICNPSQINPLCQVYCPFQHLSSICLTIYLNLFGLTNLTQKGYLIKIC